jgi:hypothetical protein
MAKPIEATPPLYGEDARLLIESLKECVSPEEIARRRAESRERLSQSRVAPFPPSMMTTKPR